MNWFAPVNWNSLLVMDVPLLEIFIRGSVIYLGLFCMLRILRRQAGEINITDLLVLVLIADAAQNGMAGDYHSLPAGLALVGTLLFWDYLLDWLGYRFPAMEKILHPPPLMLVKNGRMLRKNMKKELVTEDDLMSRLREKGVERISQVKEACLEGDGKISVVKKG